MVVLSLCFILFLSPSLIDVTVSPGSLGDWETGIIHILQMSKQAHELTSYKTWIQSSKQHVYSSQIWGSPDQSHGLKMISRELGVPQVVGGFSLSDWGAPSGPRWT